MYDQESLIKLHKSRATFLVNCVFVFFLMIIARLWFLQVYKGKLLLNYSLKNRLRRETVPAPRGMFFERNDQLIINNIPRFDAVLTPQYLKNKVKTLKKLSEILELTEKEIYEILKKKSGLASYKSIIIKKNISRKEVALIETENEELEGISVETFISREYIDRDVGAHMLGYISEISQQQLPKLRKRDNINYKLGDFIGQSGLEESLDSVIRGINGYEFVEVDASGRKKRHVNSDDLFKGISNRPSNPGPNVKLTIDRDLQLAAYAALEGKEGAAVAVDVKTGEILAMVSRPSYDPSTFSRGLKEDYWDSLRRNPLKPLRDRTVQEHYAPGSTFKTFVALAALEKGIIDENTEVSCNGKFKLGRRVFHCWKKHGHGNVNVYGAIRESCDVFFYKIATKIDIDVVSYYAKMFGFGSKLGIELPPEVPGLIPTKEWKKKRTGDPWMLGETLSCVIGQSYMLATPLQLAMAYSGIANGGTLYRPHLVKKIFSNSGKIYRESNVEKLNSIDIKQKNFEIIKRALFQVVNEPSGTAYYRRGNGIQMAGKTGTSQVIKMSAEKLFSKCEETEYKYRHHGVFVGFAPFDNPKIAVSAVVEHGCHGSSAAAPIAEQVITVYIKKYWPELHMQYLDQEKEQKQKLYEAKKQESIKSNEESAIELPVEDELKDTSEKLESGETSSENGSND